jgi:VanZ family protein
MTVFAWWAPPLALMAAIYFVSSLPTVPNVPGDPSNFLGHFGAYAVLSALTLRAVARGRWAGVTPRAALAAWAVSAAYGVTDEVHQRYVPGRYASVDDWIADALGAAVAAAALLVLARRRRPQ